MANVLTSCRREPFSADFTAIRPWFHLCTGVYGNAKSSRGALELFLDLEDLAERVLDGLLERNPGDAELLLNERRVGLEVVLTGGLLGVRDARGLVGERLARDGGDLGVVEVAGDGEVAVEAS